MNIFRALSYGKGAINEENISSLLGYFLDPSEQHDLGDTFLVQFLTLIENTYPRRFKSIFSNQFNANIEYETPVMNPHNLKKRHIDIVIRIQIDGKDEHLIGIENKIASISADEEQLFDEYYGILKLLEEESTHALLTLVFLTPTNYGEQLQKQYDRLEINPDADHKKIRMVWDNPKKDPDHRDDSICKLIQSISQNEDGITINDYVRNILTDFISFIKFICNPIKNGRMVRLREDDRYLLIRTSDSAILAYDVNKSLEKKEHIRLNAMYVLKKIIEEKSLPIELSENGKDKNTRLLGKEVIQYLCTNDIGERIS